MCLENVAHFICLVSWRSIDNQNVLLLEYIKQDNEDTTRQKWAANTETVCVCVFGTYVDR